jgi:uncharacterized protein YbjT (DUF2867 family)
MAQYRISRAIMADQTQATGQVSRKALLAGASGLVGRGLLDDLLADDRYATVLCIGRRKLPITHSKLTQSVVSFDALPALPAVDDVFITLGTTRKVAGTEAAMRAVDFDAALAVAKAGLAAGASRLGIVSAMGANASSPLFYPRLKGEVEEAVSRLGYAQIVIARPSQMDGDRASLGQPGRPAEGIAVTTMRWLRPITPRNYQIISAADVAAALHASLARDLPGKSVLLSGQMLGAAKGRNAAHA